MKKTFEEIIEIVLEHEGGYVNDPDDAGGETKYGIAKRWYPDVDIKNLTKEQAKKIIDLNFHLGIGGVVTFKNGKISDFLSSIPIERIVLETDSPYLAPVPNRGKRNEPSNTKFTLEKLAEIKNTSVENMAKITTDNFFSLFNGI